MSSVITSILRVFASLYSAMSDLRAVTALMLATTTATLRRQHQQPDLTPKMTIETTTFFLAPWSTRKSLLYVYYKLYKLSQFLFTQ